VTVVTKISAQALKLKDHSCLSITREMTALGHVGLCHEYRVLCFKVAQSSVKIHINFTTDFKFRPSLCIEFSNTHDSI